MGNIKSLPVLLRPREKALQYGLSSLSEAELLAIIIGKGTKDKSALEIAMELISIYNGITNIFQTSIYELTKIKGINKVKALELLSIKEIFLRAFKNENKDNSLKFSLSSPRDVYNYTHLIYDSLDYEMVIIFYLNNKNAVIYEQHIDSSSLDHVIIDKKLVLRNSIEKLARKVIITHNHPSGNSSPSLNDVNLFFELKKALSLINVKLIDHIVIGRFEYYCISNETKFTL